MPIFPDAPIRVRVRGSIQQRSVEGLASIVVNADGVIIVPVDDALRSTSPMLITFEVIDGVGAHGPTATTLTIWMRGGERLDAEGDARMSGLAASIVARGRVVPELTRALRTLGGRRGGAGQDTFFRPLLDARRAAAAEGVAALDAFDPAALRLALEHAIAQLAAGREPERAAARRALEARLSDAAEPLLDTLAPLAEASRRARESAPQEILRTWRLWAQAVQRVFDRADAGWLAVRSTLDATPAPLAEPDADRRWPRRRRITE